MVIQTQQTDKPLRVVVIGGGAAGFFGAIACAEANPSAQVTVLETSREVLAKVRISGGGRCNVTHHCFDPTALVQHYPRGAKALRGAFSRFQPKDTIAWFAARGVELKTEADGRIFPSTDDSGTIVDCLMNAARKAGVKLWLGAMVKTVEKVGETFRLQLRSGDELVCDRVLIATGSNPQAYQLAKALGHTIVPPVPSLFTLTIRDPRLQDLAGVSVSQAQLKLQIPEDTTKLEQTGPVLITHWGLSGPAVLKLSAWGARILHQTRYQAKLRINWLPSSTPDNLRQELLKVKSQLAKKTISGNCPVMLPRRLWESLVAQVGIAPQTRWADCSKTAMNALMQELFQGEYVVVGKGVFKEEFVTCGGVELKEVDFKTLESRVCSGLYFAGEVLDIDGVTGGFNFQSAWTTGWLAGQAMGQILH
ncbi:NAD(P)/FAD-dependent oxidoreductase [Alkalinema pantanalense CENA528]|uniref:NAD(P)/FAD-dependent oxidoreductase n=1 Tax=Alkalinema pantanalense TaxID=1620705 RepID=UPI003D6E9535